MKNWIDENDSRDNIVISSRLRLARNFKDLPFPDKLSQVQAKEIIKQAEDSFYKDNDNGEKFKSIHLWESKENSNVEYLEKRLISKKLLLNSTKAAFIIDKDQTISIMINEEDHLRIQCISSGLNLEEAYKLANEIDDHIESNADYAFHEKLGYLTACPTNLGTGLRASVMIHLPGLTMTNEMSGVLNALTQVGMTIRGMYGEGSNASCNLYQISNQVTLGISDNDILSNLNAVTEQIVNQENLSREQLMKKYNYELKDKIHRSLAILRSAVVLSEKEALKLLSSLRMGVEMGIIKDINISTLNLLLVSINKVIIQKLYDEKLSDKLINVKRAQFISEKLK